MKLNEPVNNKSFTRDIFDLSTLRATQFDYTSSENHASIYLSDCTLLFSRQSGLHDEEEV